MLMVLLKGYRRLDCFPDPQTVPAAISATLALSYSVPPGWSEVKAVGPKGPYGQA